MGEEAKNVTSEPRKQSEEQVSFCRSEAEEVKGLKRGGLYRARLKRKKKGERKPR